MRLRTRVRPARYTELRIISFEAKAPSKGGQRGFTRQYLGKCSVRRGHSPNRINSAPSNVPKGAYDQMFMDSYYCSCNKTVSNDKHNSTARPKKVGKKSRGGLARSDVLSAKTRNFSTIRGCGEGSSSPTLTKRLLLSYGCFKLEALSLSMVEICYQGIMVTKLRRNWLFMPPRDQLLNKALTASMQVIGLP